MKEFYVAKNSLLMGAAMGPGKDFSFRGFPCGQAEAMGTLTVTVSTSAALTDPYWDHVVFLTQDQISDAKGHQLTVYGNTVATSSGILFDGDGDYITSPYSDDYNLSASSFALECVVVPSGFTTGSMDIIQKDGVFGSSYIQFALGINSAKKAYFYTGNGTGISGGATGINGTTVLLANNEYHIAGTMDGNTMRLFVNGVLEATGTKATMLNSTARPLYLGYQAGQSASTFFRGVLRAARITKGVARYTNNFTIPTLPFPTA